MLDRGYSSADFEKGKLDFMSAWLFATLTALTYYVARHREVVTAFIGGKQVPQSIINEAADELDTYFQYNKLGYCK